MAVKAQILSTRKPAATNTRTFRTFLLMQQFEAKEIGARIAEARLARGLSQEELAAMASFSRRSLQDYEAGVTIPYRNMAEIGRLLNRAPEWFLYGKEAPPGDDSVATLREELAEVRGMVAQLLQDGSEPSAARRRAS